MKILYLITKSEAGGAQTHVYQLCKYFRTHHDITVMSYPGGWLEEKCKELGVTFVPNMYFSNSMNPIHALSALKKIKQITKDIQPDIVHCHSSAAGFFGRLAIRNAISTIYTAHGWGFNNGIGILQKWISVFAEKWASRYTTKIICVSQFVKNLGLHYKIAPNSKFQIVYNGVEHKHAHRKQSEGTHITFVGRLARPKLPLLLLNAMQLLPKDMQDKIQVSIVGKGPQKDKIDAYLNSKGTTNVTMHGALQREEIFAILQDSDVFVLLSEWEGLPITILEAMSVGLPIVASDVGGIHEAVGNTNGILIQSNKAQDVADAIASMLNNKEHQTNMGDVSMKKIRTTFSLEHMLERVEQVYENL